MEVQNLAGLCVPRVLIIAKRLSLTTKCWGFLIEVVGGGLNFYSCLLCPCAFLGSLSPFFLCINVLSRWALRINFVAVLLRYSNTISFFLLIMNKSITIFLFRTNLVVFVMSLLLLVLISFVIYKSCSF